MRTDTFKNLVFAFDCLVLVCIPVLLKFTARLLIDLLLDVEFSFVKNRDIIGQNSDLNLWSLCPVKRRLPPLDK